MAKLLERTREEGRNEIRAEIKAANERAEVAEATSTELKNNLRNIALRLREKGMNEAEITELLAATPAEIEEWFEQES